MHYEALCLIVQDTLGSQVLKKAKKEGLQGGTVFYGYGSSQNPVLRFFGVEESRKECLFFISTKEVVATALDTLTESFQLDKPHHGVAFTLPLSAVFGIKEANLETSPREKERKQMHQAIFVIVERGKSEDVLAAAAKAGSTGGTVIHARGSGAEETTRFFQMDIEPEKDVVLILAKHDQAENIAAEINQSLQLDQPNSGILFQMDVTDTRGIRE